MVPKIAIIDYGMGNLYSVQNAFASLGIKAKIIDRPNSVLSYDKLVLPGVGAFGDAMRELDNRGLITPLKRFISSGKPFLGICLGMQLLMDESEESKGVKGLSIISGVVKRFSSKLKCPHIGWNGIEQCFPGLEIFKKTGRNIYAYFCHSYFVKPKKESLVIGQTEYGIKFASMIRNENIYGMQFHPEKSQDTGLRFLMNFSQLC